MKTRLLNLWDRTLASYWFIPCSMMAAMYLLATGLPAVDNRIDPELFRKFFWLNITPRSAQSILASIANANISIVGVVFSITILTLSIASSQLGPRLLRTFMTDFLTHLALGIYLSTAVYCLVLLSVVKDVEESGFVPHLSVLVALGAAILGLIFLVFFIHRIAQLIQTPNIVESVANDLDRAIMRLFPELYEDSPSSDKAVAGPPDDGSATAVCARCEGYLQGIDMESLLELAVENDLIIRLRHRPGQFIPRGSEIADVWPSDCNADSIEEKLDEICVYGNRRTPRQDVECAITELTEVAVRALSPGINDPYTAINCVDRLGAALARLAQRKIPDSHQFDDNGDLRLVTKTESFDSAVNTAFDQIRQYGCGSVAVLIRILESLAVIARCIRHEGDRAIIMRQADMVMRAVARSVDEENDRADIEERYGILCELLGVEASGAAAS